MAKKPQATAQLDGDSIPVEGRPARAETVVETVQLTDGRVVDFAGKRRMLKTSTIEGGEVRLTLDFRNGVTRTFVVPPEDILRYAAHGAEQKLGDATAGLEDVEDCVLAVDDMIDRLNRHEWVIKREKGAMAGTSVLARALVELTGKSSADIRNFLADKTQAEKAALRSNPKVRPIIERLEASKRKSTVDTEALLDQLS